jgi:drug/metabolite transporter (DMT)-like permease
MRKMVEIIGVVCGLCAGVAAICTIIVIVTVLFGGRTVRLRGSTLDADWPTAAFLGLFALICAGIAWLMFRLQNRPGRQN